MPARLIVSESKPAHVPSANVPVDLMWELVEYLSWHRILATYDFATTHYTVMFPHLSATRAQQLLDEWAEARERRGPEAVH